MMRQPAELLPGVDLEEIEDEFEQLHRWTFIFSADDVALVLSWIIFKKQKS